MPGAVLIIKNGDAGGQLAGARNTTGDVLRPALQIIKTSPGITCVSGAMLLLTHAPEYGPFSPWQLLKKSDSDAE